MTSVWPAEPRVGCAAATLPPDAAPRYPRAVSAYEFDVTFLAEEGGPEPHLVERFNTALTYRLELLDERDGAYPKAGDSSYFLDGFEGPFAWELSDAELEANPPTGVYYDIVSVDPVEPAGSGRVTVTARVPL